MRRSTLLSLTLLGLWGVGSLRAQETDKITQYVQALNYDARALLALPDSGTPEMVPERTEEGTKLILCTSTKRTLDGDLDQITILSSSAKDVFPGALVLANGNLAAGKPSRISLAPGPLTLSIDLPNLGETGSIRVEEPKQSTVKAAIDKMLAVWFQDNNNGQAARQTLNIKKAYSSQQVALSLGVSAKWDSGNTFTLDSDLNKRAKTSTTIALFKQIYYTVSVDPPEQPGQAFGPEVTLGSVQAVTNASNPPAYVKSMDYGRIILIKMETQASETEANLASALTYAASGGKDAGLSADLTAKYKSIANSSQFTVVTLGGNAQAATDIMNGSKALENLPDLIHGSAVFNKQNPAYPIAYTVNFLKDNAVATMHYADTYLEQNCKTLDGNFVKVVNDAGIYAKFEITWVDKDASGQSVPHAWDSGTCAIGYEKTILMSPEASDIVITGSKSTLVNWNEVFKVRLPHPDNRAYRIKGTVFNVGWEAH